jgi:hypothetical protein
MLIIEKHVLANCICILHQHTEVKTLICGYVGIDAEHPLFGVGYEEYSPYIEEALKRAKVVRMKTDTKSLLKYGHPASWVHEIADFDFTPESYFQDCYINFSARGNVANLKEFDCPDVWFFGFDSGHPEWFPEGTYYTEKDIIMKARQLTFDLAHEMNHFKDEFFYGKDLNEA